MLKIKLKEIVTSAFASINGAVSKDLEHTRILFRSLPSLLVAVYFSSVICMNLLAGKEMFCAKYIALDCGYTLSWLSFLMMDICCKRFGPSAAFRLSVHAIIFNLGVSLIFFLVTLFPGHWNAYYQYGDLRMDNALDMAFSSSWFVVVGSAVSSLVSSVVNVLTNSSIARHLKKDNFSSFALRSYTSTLLGQFVDNMMFATIVSHTFFGWNWVQVTTCSVTATIFELLCEVIFSPLGYRLCKRWERDAVGEEYLRYISGRHCPKPE